MKSIGVEQMGCDRRILKAFYTQYVAVLLIILVFTVGAFQRTTATTSSIVEAIPVMMERPSIGALELAQDFDAAGQLLGDTSQLQAVVAILEAHDVRAVITVAMRGDDSEVDRLEIENSLGRLESLEKFFTDQGLAESSVMFTLGGPEAQRGKIVIHFEEVRHDNLPL